MGKGKGFTPLEIKISKGANKRFPKRHGETDVRQQHRSFLTGFTLIELLVVIAIIALLLAILMPSLQRVKKQAQAVACMSNIKQWSYCWHMYLEDSGGKFPSGAGASGDWPNKLRPYYKDRGALTLCPSAKKPYTDGGKVPFGAWRWRQEGGGWTDFESKSGDDYGSYGLDEWLGDRPEDNYWKTREQKKANNIPMFFDCVFLDTFLTLRSRKTTFMAPLCLLMHTKCISRLRKKKRKMLYGIWLHLSDMELT